MFGEKNIKKGGGRRIITQAKKENKMIFL